jgi:Tfp pilus assembly protein PilN
MRRSSLPAVSLAFVAAPARLHIAGAIALSGAVALAGVMAWSYQQEQAALRMARSSLLELKAVQKRQAKAGEVSVEQLELAQKQIDAANGVIRRLNLPWDELFSTLEASVGDDVVLIDVAPDPEARTVGIVAEARHPQAMLEYAQRLAGNALLKNVFIQSHQVVTQDPQKPVRFTIAGQWVTPVADARQRAGGPP